MLYMPFCFLLFSLRIFWWFLYISPWRTVSSFSWLISRAPPLWHCWHFGLAILVGFLGNSVVKYSPANAGVAGLIPGSGRSHGEGSGNLLQYSCLENSMDRGAWWATVNGPQQLDTTNSDCGDCPMHQGMLNRTLAFTHQMPAASHHLPGMTTEPVSRHCQLSPQGLNRPQLEPQPSLDGTMPGFTRLFLMNI